MKIYKLLLLPIPLRSYQIRLKSVHRFCTWNTRQYSHPRPLQPQPPPPATRPPPHYRSSLQCTQMCNECDDNPADWKAYYKPMQRMYNRTIYSDSRELGSVQARSMVWSWINPYPTAFPYGNAMVLHFYQQQESSTTKTVHKVINKGLKTYV